MKIYDQVFKLSLVPPTSPVPPSDSVGHFSYKVPDFRFYELIWAKCMYCAEEQRNRVILGDLSRKRRKKRSCMVRDELLEGRSVVSVSE